MMMIKKKRMMMSDDAAATADDDVDVVLCMCRVCQCVCQYLVFLKLIENFLT